MMPGPSFYYFPSVSEEMIYEPKICRNKIGSVEF